MITLFAHIAVIALWGATIAIHLRRLFRLARVQVPAVRSGGEGLRREAERVWWWLGRHEFWRALQDDTLTCLQITVLLFLWLMGAVG